MLLESRHRDGILSHKMIYEGNDLFHYGNCIISLKQTTEDCGTHHFISFSCHFYSFYGIDTLNLLHHGNIKIQTCNYKEMNPSF